MKIAFYKGWEHGRFADRVICLATISQYSHCEMVFSDGMCASATMRDKGVRFKRIDLDSGRWDVYNLNIRASDEELIRAFFNLHEGMPYDLIGALGSWLYLDIGCDEALYCSKACAIVLQQDAVNSPGSLFRKLRDINMI